MLECRLIAGTTDYIPKIIAKNTEDFASIYRQHRTRLLGAVQVQSSFAFPTVFKTTALNVTKFYVSLCRFILLSAPCVANTVSGWPRVFWVQHQLVGSGNPCPSRNFWNNCGSVIKRQRIRNTPFELGSNDRGRC